MIKYYSMMLFFLYIPMGASESKDKYYVFGKFITASNEEEANQAYKGLMGGIFGATCVGLGLIESMLRCVIFSNDSKSQGCLSLAGNCFGANGIDPYCISNYALCGAGCLTCAICNCPSSCKDSSCCKSRGDDL